MDLRTIGTVFVTIFLAEIADKTQFATLLFAADAERSKLAVFLGSAIALVVASAIAVFAGGLISRWMDEAWMGRIAGAAFILVGVWTVLRAGT